MLLAQALVCNHLGRGEWKGYDFVSGNLLFFKVQTTLVTDKMMDG